ncbi:MAG: ferrochelatase, partial [Betaproteobacteria bacterium]|nr:ferrochelatase [Betaproteobacteria bacterium]
MARYSAANAFDHSMPSSTAVLLVQLGTPDAPETSAVRRYLREFLSDPRVVEIPKLVWALILNGIILNVRPARSAEKYATIWTDQGSPLAVHTANQARRLGQALEARGHSIEVAWAMRYGRPAISQVMREMRERNVTRLLVLPLYPQYAASTTATAFDAVFSELSGWRNQPELRTIRNFHDDGPYIEALARHVEAYWAREGKPDVLVMSFHGVPRRSLLLGDP